VTDLDGLVETIELADVVISATASAESVVDPDALTDVGETFIVDITRPRDIPERVDSLSHLTVYDLDRLETVTQKTRRMRREAAIRVEEIVDEEFEQLLVQYKRQRADSVISAMYESAERVKASELERTLAELDLEDEQEAVVESMADAIVSQLLAAPTNSLRDAAENDDWETIHTALRLFNPAFGPDTEAISPAFVSEMGSGEIPDAVREQFVSKEQE
jgi:glutamyl-tRNA reductase